MPSTHQISTYEDFVGRSGPSPRPHKGKELGAWHVDKTYVNATEKETGECSFEIVRLWQWNGATFVRLREEPSFYHLPPATS